MVVKSDEFLTLTHSQVISLIGSNELGVSSEEDVFEAVCSWVKRDRFVDIFKCLYLVCTNRSLHQLSPCRKACMCKQIVSMDSA